MIYLIKVEYKDVTLLKVGYAKDIKKRLTQYTTENPLFELLDYREGDRKLEDFLHSMFKEYKFEKGREWFYYNDYIVNNFHSDFKGSILIEKIKKKMNKFKSFSSKLRLYCEFKEKYPEIDFIIEKFQLYLEALGLDRCRELRYKESLLYEELSKLGYFDNNKLSNEDDKIIDDFISSVLYSSGSFRDKMKLYCEFRDQYSDSPLLLTEFDKRTPTFRRYLHYYNFYGTAGCRARGYEESELIDGMKDHLKKGMLSTEIYLNFREGDKITLVEAKEKLKEIYNKLSISKTPKATDLNNYFLMSKTKIQTENGIKHGFKLGEKLL